MAAQGCASSGRGNRHERMTVAMELATALHHSAQRVEVLREGVEGEQHYAPRRPKPPLPGKRPGVPLDPEPQGGVVTVVTWRPVPPLAVPLLASAAGEVVDHSTPSSSSSVTPSRRRKVLEEEERRKKLQESVVRLRTKVLAGDLRRRA